MVGWWGRACLQQWLVHQQNSLPSREFWRVPQSSHVTTLLQNRRPQHAPSGQHHYLSRLPSSLIIYFIASTTESSSSDSSCFGTSYVCKASSTLLKMSMQDRAQQQLSQLDKEVSISYLLPLVPSSCIQDIEHLKTATRPRSPDSWSMANVTHNLNSCRSIQL